MGISGAAFRKALTGLRAEYAIVNYDPIDGVDCYLNKPGQYDVSHAFGRTMRITWTPAYPRTASSSSLLVQKGRVIAGKEPRWHINQARGLSYDLLFGQGSTRPTPQS